MYTMTRIWLSITPRRFGTRGPDLIFGKIKDLNIDVFLHPLQI
jgi:hypothetical protein